MLKFYSFALYIFYKIHPESILYQAYLVIGSMIISTVQFLWSHSYLVVIKYMSYVAVYTLYVGIWMINCDIYSFNWNCIQYNDSVFTILKGVREDIYVHVRSLPCKVIDYNIFCMHTYFRLLILFSCKDMRKVM